MTRTQHRECSVTFIIQERHRDWKQGPQMSGYTYDFDIDPIILSTKALVFRHGSNAARQSLQLLSARMQSPYISSNDDNDQSAVTLPVSFDSHVSQYRDIRGAGNSTNSTRPFHLEEAKSQLNTFPQSILDNVHCKNNAPQQDGVNGRRQ